jgi:O-antigen/teichoic acid export membrane protein
MAGSAGTVFVVGCLIGAGLIGAGLAVGGQALAFAALGLGLPGLLVQDAYRLGMIADGRAKLSFGSDLIWAIVMVILLVGLSALVTEPSVPVFIVIWVAGALGGSIYAIWACGVLPAPTKVRAWFASNTRLIRGFTVSGLADPAAGTMIQYLLAVVAGLVAVAAIRAGQLLLSPLTVGFQGLFSVITPEASKTLRLEPGKLVQRMSKVATAVVIITFGYGLVIGLLPDSIGEELLGDSWVHARPVVPLLVVAVAAQFAAAPAWSGLLVMGAAASMAKMALVTAPMSVVLAVAGGAWGGAMGAAAGLATGYLFAMAVQWFVFVRHSRATRGTTDFLPDVGGAGGGLVSAADALGPAREDGDDPE